MTVGTDQEVLIVGFGPVQGFVAAARKTADLTLGSQLLSELVRAAAQAVADAAGGDDVLELVVPAPATLVTGQGHSNKLVALIRGGAARHVGDLARQAADARLGELASHVRERASGFFDEALFDQQIALFLECAWASAAMTADESFGAVRRRAERALDGRKALRDFKPYFATGNRPKASVDGRLESVVTGQQVNGLRRRCGLSVLKENEEIDAIGLVRRLWRGSKSTVPSTAAIAVAPWVAAAQVTTRGAAALAGVDTLREHLASAIRRAAERDADADFAIFDDDWSWLLEDPSTRQRDIEFFFERQKPAPVSSALAALDDLARTVVNDTGWGGRPTPYFAVISADGDGMGQAFSRLRTAREHTAASLELSRFGATIRDVADRSAGIHLAYAGGDDLLALASLDDALPFIDRIRLAFGDIRAFGSPPTVSIGLALVHHRDRLSESVALARIAERAAKEHHLTNSGTVGGNRLAIVLSKRSGGDLQVVLNLADGPAEIFDRVVALLRAGEMPRGIAHELNVTAADLELVPLDSAKAEIERLLKRKRTRSDDQLKASLIRELLDITGVARSRSGSEFVDACTSLSVLLRVAQHLAEHTQPRAHVAMQTPAAGEAGAA